MRQNPNSRRSRGRSNRKPGNPRNQIFDSNGPGARVRGNSAQIYEKYQQLARDASSSGDRVAAEGFYQHAEHYYRLMDAAGLNREGGQQDQNQQRNADGNAASNGAAVGGGEAPAEQVAAAPGESVTASVAPVAAEASVQGEPASAEAVNGSGKSDIDAEAKPARRSRRSNGSANGRSKPAPAAEAEKAEDGSESPSEDTEPVSA